MHHHSAARQFPAVLFCGWLGSRVASVLDSGAEGPGFKSQPRRCRVTVLGKLFTPVVPPFTKQQIGSSPLKGCGGGVTAGLAESNGNLPPGLWFTSPAGWLPRTGISSGTLRSVIEYGLPLPFYCSVLFFSRRRCDGWPHHGRSFSIYPPAAVMRDTGRMHRCCQCHLPNSVEFIDTEQRSDGRTDARQFHNFTHTIWALAINLITITVFTFSFFVLYF